MTGANAHLFETPDVDSWFCATILYRFINGVLEFCVMKYRPDPINRPDEFHWKFPGGTNGEKPEDLNPAATFVREASEEIGVLVDPSRSELVHTVFKPAANGRPSHRQYFLKTSSFVGVFRNRPIWDGKELLEVTEWAVVDRKLYEKFFWTHRQAMANAAEELGCRLLPPTSTEARKLPRPR